MPVKICRKLYSVDGSPIASVTFAIPIACYDSSGVEKPLSSAMPSLSKNLLGLEFVSYNLGAFADALSIGGIGYPMNVWLDAIVGDFDVVFLHA